jgi:hypothetical protein
MHRFRLLGFYVAGIVAAVGLTIGGISMRRTADDHGTRGAGGRVGSANNREYRAEELGGSPDSTEIRLDSVLGRTLLLLKPLHPRRPAFQLKVIAVAEGVGEFLLMRY